MLTRNSILALLLAAGTLVSAAPVRGACAAEGIGSVEERNGGLWVVTPEEPAFRAGDRILQVNDRAVNRCEDLRAALAAAASRQVAPLVLCLREGRRIAVVASRKGGRKSASPDSEAPKPWAASAPEPAQPRLAPAEVALALEVLENLGRAGEAILPRGAVRPLLALPGLSKAIADSRRRIEKVPAVQRVVAPVMEDYEVVTTLLRYLVETQPRDGIERLGIQGLYNFHNGSEVARLLHEHPVLLQAVERMPGKTVLGAERSGLWRPGKALELALAQASSHSRDLARHLGELRAGH